MANAVSHLGYYGSNSFCSVMQDIHVTNIPSIPYTYEKLKLSETIKKSEDAIAADKAKTDSLKGRISHLEQQINHPSLRSQIERIAKTCALILGYTLLAATVIGAAFVVLIEVEFELFKNVSSPVDARRELARKTSKLANVQHRITDTEQKTANLQPFFREKTPEITATLEDRIARFKETEYELLKNSATNPLWHTQLGQNERVRIQYERALGWLKEFTAA